jgi:hypothetical protein
MFKGEDWADFVRIYDLLAQTRKVQIEPILPAIQCHRELGGDAL